MLEVESQSLSEKDQGAITEKLDTNSSQPTVTIGIPVLNEEEHIERVVSGFLDAGYPNLVEILIADGGSKDRTRKIVSKLSEKDNRVKLIDNPNKYQSFALNRMIDVAEGEVFLRADGHCYYQDDYIQNCVSVMLETGARNVGGAQRYMASNLVQAGIAMAVKSFLGNGGAKYMQESYEGYADTVFLGCFWTKDLKKIGGFNTENITNQDSELNLRLIENFGDSVYVSPKIKSWYFPRDSFGNLFKQYFRYGRGRYLTKSLHPKVSPVRGLLPFVTILMLVGYFIFDLLSDPNLYSLHVLLILSAVVLAESIRITVLKRIQFKNEIWVGDKRPPFLLNQVLACFITIALMQVAHFSGFLFQFLKRRFGKKKGW